MKPMTQTTAINLGLVIAALGLSLLATLRPTEAQRESPAPSAATASVVSVVDGVPVVFDSDGTPAPVRNYARIASGSLITDHVLLELCAPERTIAFTTYSGESPVDGHKFSGKPHIPGADDVEALLHLKPDLLFISTQTSPAKVARLREAGLTVFNLGEMRGLRTFPHNVRQIAALVGAEAQGEHYVRTFEERLSRVAVGLPSAARKTAIYLSVFGTQMYGGARNTSHHDLLESAGLIDIAANVYEGWPRLTTVQLLELDPELIVLKEGAGVGFCELAGASGLRACANTRSGIIEGPQDLWSAPGANLLPASELLHRLAYKQ
ncbi:MAG: hypothetical protein RJA70_4486 [Pseudomonadota bacterium]|jgi:iron complex transport system substrate-binding protein